MSYGNKCYRCTKEAGVRGNVEFSFWGFDFKLPYSRIFCAKCVRDNFISSFKGQKCFKLVSLDDSGKINVNWLLYTKDHNSTRQRALDTTLLALQILSFSQSGNWAIMTDSLGLCPSVAMSQVYFTRREDVIAYAGLMYSRAHYPWFIVQLGEVVSRDDAISALRDAEAVTIGAE